MARILSVLPVLLLVWPAADATELDLDFNNDAARLNIAWPLPGGNLTLDGGWLHHEDRGDVAHFGIHLVGQAAPGPDPITAGLGVRMFYMDPDSSSADGTSLAIGGFLRYRLPNYNRIGIGGHAYYGPDVIGFGDAKEYREIGAHVSYNVLREADVYLGYRNVKGKFDGASDVTFDTGLHVGIRLNF